MEPHVATQAPAEYLVRIDAEDARLVGQLVVPASAAGLVVFAHGMGTKLVSQTVRDEAGAATLLVELEAGSASDIDGVARRLLAVTDYAVRDPRVRNLPLGLFGAGAGAAAALVAAVERPDRVAAIVSCGGHLARAGVATLRAIGAPTLLIVGGEDAAGLELNVQVARVMRAEHRLTVIEGARSRFEEPGTLREAALHASRWFRRYLPSRGRPLAGRGE